MTSSRKAELSRRDFLRFTAAGAALTSMSGWLDVMAAHAAGTGVKHKSCILLWMEGGPSQKDTFDMKPGTKDAGEFKPIARSEEHTSELQSRVDLVCRLLLEKKKKEN